MLSGKNAVVTGASRGIGKAIVEAFARNGANVWACARKPDGQFEAHLAELADECHVWVKPVYFELTEEDQIKAGMKQILSEHKNIDILVNNAGVFVMQSFQMTPMEKIRNAYQINLFAPMLITQTLLRAMMRTKNGSIVNIGSMAGEKSSPGNSIYGSSKAALMHWTTILASETAANGVRVNAVAPGNIETDILAAHRSEVRETLHKESFMDRLGTPAEIAVTFLASDMAKYINGAVLDVNGGTQ